MNVQDANSNLNQNKFPYRWKLADGFPAKEVEKHNTTVFTTFACGGGSSMGYKLAGFDIVAANDIDPQMQKVYEANFKPKKYYLCDIKELLKRNDLPKVDVLDGSPPCSVFSMAGSREKAWQKDKHFREGQAVQVLDDLFFDFVELVNKVQPKVVIAENVKGMLIGNAKWYTKEIVKRFKAIGYNCQVFLLNAASMGVPQRRERVFFIATKTNKIIKLDFNEKPILFEEIDDGIIENFTKIEKSREIYYDSVKKGQSISTAHPKGSFFNSIKLSDKKIPNTLASGSYFYHYKQKRKLTNKELALISSFPLDYNYLNLKPQYLMGMSVPPVMMAQVAYQVYLQLIKTGN